MRDGARLSILHTCWEGHPSGQTRVILDLARGQTSAGHRVCVACPADSPLEETVRTAGIAAAPLRFGRPAETGALIARTAAQHGAELVNAHSSRDRRAVLWARRHGRMEAAVVFTRHVRTLTFPLRLWWQSLQVGVGGWRHAPCARGHDGGSVAPVQRACRPTARAGCSWGSPPGRAARMGRRLGVSCQF